MSGSSSGTYAESFVSCPAALPLPPPVRRRLAFPDDAGGLGNMDDDEFLCRAADQLERSYYETKRRAAQSLMLPSPAYREVQCTCGRGACALQQEGNGRWRYVCPARLKCNYSAWCDEADLSPSPQPPKPSNPHVFTSPTNQRLNDTVPAKVDPQGARSNDGVPICHCGAGKCSKRSIKGREYYVCHIKQGQGACTHFMPVDGADRPPDTGSNSPRKGTHLSYNPVEKDINGNKLDQVLYYNKSEPVNPDLSEDDDWLFDIINDDIVLKVVSAAAQQTPCTEVAPESPIRPHQPNYIVQTPMKIPIPPNGTRSPITPGSSNCFQCGEEGHWAKNCPSSTCFSCGKAGHWVKDCPARLDRVLRTL